MPVYRIERDGKTIEVPDFSTLRAWAEGGRIRAEDKVWSQGWKEPVRAYDVSGLREIFKTRSAAPNATSYASGPVYIVFDGREQVSAPNFSSLQQLTATGRVRADDLVWTEGWEAWARAYDVSGLRDIFKKRNEQPAATMRKPIPPLPSVSTSAASSSSPQAPRQRAHRRASSQAPSHPQSQPQKPSWVAQVGETFKELNSLAKEGFEKMGFSRTGQPNARTYASTGRMYQADPDQDSAPSNHTAQSRNHRQINASAYRHTDAALWHKEPWRYRREQGPFTLADLLSPEHLQSYLSLRRHRKIEVPLRKILPNIAPSSLFQALVPDARILRGQDDRLVAGLLAQMSAALVLPAPVDIYVSAKNAWEMSLLGNRQQSAILVGEGWLEELSEVGVAGLFAQLLSQSYLQDAPLRTLAWLLWKPEDFSRIGVHSIPAVDSAFLLDCLMEADHLGDLISLMLLGHEDAVIDALEEMVEVSEAPRALERSKAVQSIQAYFDTPAPALAERVPALERFAKSHRFQNLTRGIAAFPSVRSAILDVQRIAGIA